MRLDADVYLVREGAAPFVSACEPDTVSLSVALTPPGDDAAGSFLPTLRSTAGPLGRRLAKIAVQPPRELGTPMTGSEATDWWSTLEHEEHTLRARALRICCVKPATRNALFRRVLLSADFIQSHYQEPLNVELLAAVSNLSPFHFARLFALVMDETPHAFLTRKRLAVARRLLASGLGRGEVAERAGFGCRSTLFRHLREPACLPS